MRKTIYANWDELPLLLSINQMAILFGVTDQTIKRWVKKGLIPHKSVEKTIVFPKARIKELTGA